jgi:FMN-dependent NADH-azoreductase
MSRSLLSVLASPRAERSESTAIANAFLDAYREANPTATVDVLDLWNEPLPVYGGKGVEAKMTVFGGETPTGEAADAWADVVRVTERFAAADHYLFAVPMWNAGVPWVLKHLIDTISQPGLTFGFDAERGYDPLLHDKRAAVVYASAVYAPGLPKGFGIDFQSPYFEDWLRFIGIDDIRTVHYHPTVAAADFDALRRDARDQARALGASFTDELRAVA